MATNWITSTMSFHERICFYTSNGKMLCQSLFVTRLSWTPHEIGNKVIQLSFVSRKWVWNAQHYPRPRYINTCQTVNRNAKYCVISELKNPCIWWSTPWPTMFRSRIPLIYAGCDDICLASRLSFLIFQAGHSSAVVRMEMTTRLSRSTYASREACFQHVVRPWYQCHDMV